MQKKLIAVAGPTAAGKTRMGIELAKKLSGEIVSADSMQIYRHMDIGTAKATAEERAQVPHHMLDVAGPDEDYSVARYVQEASVCCEDIVSRGRLPIVTGGTGLYIDSLISGTDFARRQEDDDSLREGLLEEYDRIGGEEMLRKLSEVDPERAQKLSAGDRRRICRALEIYKLTGITATEHDRRSRALPEAWEAKYIVLNYADRAELYEHIERRVDIMIEEGLFDEVKSLLSMGLSPSCTAMQAIGYKESAAALRGEISFDEAVRLIKQSSRRYAKRQLTWFRRRKDAFWINWDSRTDFEKGLEMALDYIGSFGK